VRDHNGQALDSFQQLTRQRAPDRRMYPGGLNLSCFRFAMIGSCRVHLPVAIVFDWERGPTARTSVMKKKAKKKSKGT
jgi:hypothetical protein